MPITLDAVAKIAAKLPDAELGDRYGGKTWTVGKKVFMWERGFSKADIKRFGTDRIPESPLLALITEDLHTKEAILAENKPGFFTIPHFDNYALFLVELKKAKAADVREVIEEAYECAKQSRKR